jgi:IS4 transposase
VIPGQRRPAEVLHTRPLSDDARAARVISDETVRLGPDQSNSRAAALTHPVRRVVIAKRNQGRPRPDRRPDTEVVLYTNRLDLPAEVVAAIYELRWSIELFFRFLKQTLKCRKLLSEKPNAAAIQLYCALIAALLLARVTGGPVTAKLLRILCLYLQGWADDEEVLAAIKRAAADRKKKDP